LLLIAFFMFRGFPYDQLGDKIVRRIEQTQGARLVFDQLAPRLQLAGPALQGIGVRATLASGDLLELDRALVRAAWSTSWLTGDPAIHIELEGPAGGASGTLQWNGSTAWNGSIWNVPAAHPPLSELVPIIRLEGLVSARIDIRIGEEERDGKIDFEVREGSFWLPNSSVALPFDLLSGVLHLGGDGYLTVESFRVEGSSVSGTGSGEIAQAATFEQAPVNLELELEIRPALAGKLRSAGLRVNRKGPSKIRISGTVAQPTIR
jgi:type II secretion system protein N